MRTMQIHIFALFLLTFLASACENEVDLNAPKKDITAAYGVVDPTDSLHFIKVNKSFLPQSNAETYAASSYSGTYYENISVRILEKQESGGTQRSFTLNDTMVNKEEGLFEHDEAQTLYYFEADDLDHQYEYALRILIDEGTDSEKSVKGNSDLVGPIDITSHNPGSQFGNQLYFYSGGEYREEEIEWSEVDNAAEHTLSLRFHYANIFQNGDTVERSFDWEVGKKGRRGRKVKMAGKSFYQRMDSELSPNPSGLTERRMKGVDLLFETANRELKTYKTVAGPNSSIVQHRPDYSNLDTAAVGIFASARHRHFRGLKISDNSLDQLIQGDITSHLKFTN